MTSLAARIRDPRPGRVCQRGLWLTFLGPFGVEAVAGATSAAGLDWLGVDLQHGAFEPADVAAVLRASRLPVLVRVASHHPAALARVLDAGADGVIVPAVESAAQARALVDAAYPPPRGHRSTGVCRAALVGAASLADGPLILPMIETRAGLDDAAEILDVDGVDGVFVGPYDLALSLGAPSVTAEPVLEAIDAVLAGARERGRATGLFAGNAQLTRRYADVDLLGVDSDVNALRVGLAALFGTPEPDASA
jgi:2-keto-3-deoxy-L-rhamnonate aldolase RhmA